MVVTTVVASSLPLVAVVACSQVLVSLAVPGLVHQISLEFRDVGERSCGTEVEVEGSVVFSFRDVVSSTGIHCFPRLPHLALR